MKQLFTTALSVCVMIAVSSCNNNETKKETVTAAAKPQIKSEAVTYQLDSLTMNGYAAWDSSSDKKRPVVMVVHEWWGLNDYTKSRVNQLAELGYLAFAVDMYGNGKTADNPTLAGELAGPFYKDAVMARARFDAGVTKALTHITADSSKIGAIGYCFGGTQLINFALLGDPLKGIVSFHGGLQTTPPFDKSLLTSKMLVLHGDADPFVPADQVAAFRKGMDSIGATYTFIGYPGATHAFTNPGSTEVGKKFDLPIAYNAAADTASWKEMKMFFDKIFK